MSFEEFVAAAENRLQEEVSGDVTVRLLSAQKNNNVKRNGVLFLKEGELLSPTIYLEEYYEKYRQGMSLTDITFSIIALYKELHDEPFWLSKDMACYEEVREMIAYRLINQERNLDILHDIPYKPYLDLAVVYYLLLEIGENGSASALIHREQMEMWGVTEEELHEEAIHNTVELLPMEFKGIDTVIRSLAGLEETGMKDLLPEDLMYVLSNCICNYGAAAILYEGVTEKIADLLDDSYYVLPSSIHELIIVPGRNQMDAQTLETMVREINETQVGEEEILSNHIYYYDKEKEPELKIVRHEFTK